MHVHGSGKLITHFQSGTGICVGGELTAVKRKIILLLIIIILSEN